MKRLLVPLTAEQCQDDKRLAQVMMPVGGQVLSVFVTPSGGLGIFALIDPVATAALHKFWITSPGVLIEPLLGRTLGEGWMVMAPTPEGPRPMAVIQDLPWPKASSPIIGVSR